MVEKLNCTLDKFEWVTAGTDPPLSPCENQTESFAKIFEADFANFLENCETPCRWTDYNPRLTNFDHTYYVGSSK